MAFERRSEQNGIYVSHLKRFLANKETVEEVLRRVAKSKSFFGHIICHGGPWPWKRCCQRHRRGCCCCYHCSWWNSFWPWPIIQPLRRYKDKGGWINKGKGREQEEQGSVCGGEKSIWRGKWENRRRERFKWREGGGPSGLNRKRPQHLVPLLVISQQVTNLWLNETCCYEMKKSVCSGKTGGVLTLWQ